MHHAHDRLPQLWNACPEGDATYFALSLHQKAKEHIPTSDQNVEVVDGKLAFVLRRQELNDVHMVKTSTGLDQQNNAFNRRNGCDKLLDLFELLPRQSV